VRPGVLASCAAGALANCEDVTDPLWIVIVMVFAVAGLFLLTVAAILCTATRGPGVPVGAAGHHSLSAG